MARTVKLEGSIKDTFKPLTKAQVDKLRKKTQAKKPKAKK